MRLVGVLQTWAFSLQEPPTEGLHAATAATARAHRKNETDRFMARNITGPRGVCHHHAAAGAPARPLLEGVGKEARARPYLRPTCIAKAFSWE